MKSKGSHVQAMNTEKLFPFLREKKKPRKSRKRQEVEALIFRDINLQSSKDIIGLSGCLTVLFASAYYFIFLCYDIALKIELSCKFLAEFCNLRWIR